MYKVWQNTFLTQNSEGVNFSVAASAAVAVVRSIGGANPMINYDKKNCLLRGDKIEVYSSMGEICLKEFLCVLKVCMCFSFCFLSG